MRATKSRSLEGGGVGSIIGQAIVGGDRRGNRKRFYTAGSL